MYNSGADILMIFEELLNAIHSITQIKISPDIKNDISIPEMERIKGIYFAEKLTMNSLSIIWQVLFKGFQELQIGFHLYQLGEMIILRLIFISNNPNPDSYTKENLREQNTENKLENIDKEIKKKK